MESTDIPIHFPKRQVQPPTTATTTASASTRRHQRHTQTDGGQHQPTDVITLSLSPDLLDNAPAMSLANAFTFDPPTGPPNQQPPQPPTATQSTLQSNGLPQRPHQPSAGAQVNGAGAYTATGQAGSAWGAAPTNVGEHMDMNVLWELVNNLSEVHQGIREQTNGVLQRVQMVQARSEAAGMNG
jgi:hypothetical protein